MNKKLLLLLTFVFSLFAQHSGLIISEYIEGSSNNKAIEIYNGTGADIDLMNYAIVLISNGRDTIGNNLTFDSSRSLANGGTYVIANSRADANILNKADTTSTVTFFNGDDDLAIMTRANFNSRTLTFIDYFGQRSVDPGSFYEANGVKTQNQTLRRKSTVTTGDTNDQNVFDPSVEWDQFDINTFDGLGSHTTAGAGYGFSSNPSVTNISKNSADVRFSATDSSTATVYYGTTTAYGDSVKFNGLATSFNSTISGLAQSTTYHLKVKIIKKGGTEFKESSDLTFTTSSPVQLVSIDDIIKSFATYDGKSVSIRGILLNDFGSLQSSRTNIYIVSNTGYSINLSSSTKYNALKRGDDVTITGTIGKFRKVVQISPANAPVVNSMGNTVPDPMKVSTNDVKNHSRIGQYVEVVGTVEDSYNTGSSGGNIEINDGSGTAVARVWATTGLSATSAKVDQKFRLRGAIGTFVSGSDTIAQILPSVSSDIELFTNTIDDSGVSDNSLMIPAVTFDIDNGQKVSYRFKIKANSTAKFSIYDMSGKRIKSLGSKKGTGSIQEASWDKLNSNYQRVRIGTYILYMEVTEENGKKISKHVPLVIGARL